SDQGLQPAPHSVNSAAADIALIVVSAGVGPHAQIANSRKSPAPFKVAARQGGCEDRRVDHADVVSDELRSTQETRDKLARGRGREVHIPAQIEIIPKPFEIAAELIEQPVLVVVVVPPEPGAEDPVICRIQPAEPGAEIAGPVTGVVSDVPAGAHPDDELIWI